MKKLPKIHALGSKYCEHILSGPVEITGKLDGSQFRIYKPAEGSLVYGSRSQQEGDLQFNKKQFQPAIDFIEFDDDGMRRHELLEKLPVGTTVFGEYVGRINKHKILYTENKAVRIFLYHYDDRWYSPDWISLNTIDTVPIINRGHYTVADCMDIIDKMDMEKDKLEGIVIKNYDSEFHPYSDRFAKLVLPEFREVKSDKFPLANQKDLKLEAVFLDRTLTHNRVEKMIWCLSEDERTMDMGMMSKIMPLLYEDVIREELPDFILAHKPNEFDFRHVRKGFGRLTASILKEVLYSKMREDKLDAAIKQTGDEFVKAWKNRKKDCIGTWEVEEE